MALNQAKPIKTASTKNLTQGDIQYIIANMDNNLLTKLSLSLYFRVSERTIERWEDLGMPVVIIGKVHRYDLDKVMKWADKQGKVIS